MNNLEQFIKSRREEFDSKIPREKLWSRIEADLDNSKGDWGWMWKAAVVVLLAVCSFLIWERSHNQPVDSTVASEYMVNPEFVETELYYTQLIAQKSQMVAEYDLEDPELKENFKRDLASLDTMYQELQEEYVVSGNDVVLEAMIENLQLRMELLNQQLEILAEIKNDYNNETIETKNL